MRKPDREEINRKLLHVLSGSLIPGGIFYLPMVPGLHPATPAVLLGVLLAVALAVEAMRFHVPWVQRTFYAAAGGALRPEEERRITGATYIFASGFLCALLFYRAPHLACMALSMFILGDAAAALVGLSIGRIRIGDKTLEGTLACFLVCLLLCVAVFPLLPRLLDSWGGRMPVLLAVTAALCTALLELFPLRISHRTVLNDNLTVPVLTGLVMLWLYPWASRVGW
jgi:dolichol kinase